AELTPELTAPVLEGQEIGKVRVMADGELLLEYPICAAAAVEEMTLSKALSILWGTMLKM
ncbi:MAG: D-alanyl-D-alanine carboxypeptidase, partial [Angelakisella sp.]